MIFETGPGVWVTRDSTRFTVRAPEATALWLCLFDNGHEERVAMDRHGHFWQAEVPADLSGTAYGYRAEGEWVPQNGQWFDPAKLLVDPTAVLIDRPFVQDPTLSQYGVDTASLVPKAIVFTPLPDVPKAVPLFSQGGLIYELNVRGFTKLHPDVPEAQRGTIAALAHPAVIAHFKSLNVAAVELMPIVAWIDERHLPPLGLSNAWGYNPVAMMPLDPRLAPGGYAELREAVAALHAEGIGVILDIVLNHTGESDALGPILSLRGLDNAAYAHAPDGSLINDSGCGNTLDFANPYVRALATTTLRHFVRQCGVDGFRFDLAPILARGPGFDAEAPIFSEIRADPWLSDRIMIAEPWDIGPGGYQLGRFPRGWIEWNDRFRDDVRRFWRGDGNVGALATRLAGSSDIFGAECRSVNFLAAHDGFTLADTVAYAQRHNEANGEGNRDGHGENFSWNNGAEGPTENETINSDRRQDLRALLTLLFASHGAIMLTAGDEFGRSQQGNNNAYAQDNGITWVDWGARDEALEAFVASLSRLRHQCGIGAAPFDEMAQWLTLDGSPMSVADWENPATRGFVLKTANFSLRVDRAARTVELECDDIGLNHTRSW